MVVAQHVVARDKENMYLFKCSKPALHIISGVGKVALPNTVTGIGDPILSLCVYFPLLSIVSHDSFLYLSAVVTCDKTSSSIFQTTTTYTLRQE